MLLIMPESSPLVEATGLGLRRGGRCAASGAPPPSASTTKRSGARSPRRPRLAPRQRRGRPALASRPASTRPRPVAFPARLAARGEGRRAHPLSRQATRCTSTEPSGRPTLARRTAAPHGRRASSASRRGGWARVPEQCGWYLRAPATALRARHIWPRAASGSAPRIAACVHLAVLLASCGVVTGLGVLPLPPAPLPKPASRSAPVMLLALVAAALAAALCGTPPARGAVNRGSNTNGASTLRWGR